MTENPLAPAAEDPVDAGRDGLSFRCPRCATAVSERFYGPCRPCRRQLAESVGGVEGKIVTAAARFEPPMHVTPNAVATRD